MTNKNEEKIVLKLDIPKTADQINADIKKLQNRLDELKLSGTLDAGSAVRQLTSQINALQSQLKTITMKTEIDTAPVRKAGQDIKDMINNLKTVVSEVKFFRGFKNIGKRRMSVRLSKTVICFEYALHA